MVALCNFTEVHFFLSLIFPEGIFIFSIEKQKHIFTMLQNIERNKLVKNKSPKRIIFRHDYSSYLKKTSYGKV